MVHYSKVINGLATFIDREIIAKMAGGWRSWMIGSAAGVALARAEQVYRKLADNEMLRSLGVIDGENVDIDIIYEQLRQQANHGSMTIDLPLIGGITFGVADVDALYRYIKGA